MEASIIGFLFLAVITAGWWVFPCVEAMKIIRLADKAAQVLAPRRRDIAQTRPQGTLAITMDELRPYHRGLYRLPLDYPAMYCVTSTVGEGKISNLSAVGCSIETDEPLSQSQQVALRLLLPDKAESLPIEAAEVRWTNGTRAGVEFIQVERQANLRLHTFVWDKMVERIQSLQQQQRAAS